MGSVAKKIGKGITGGLKSFTGEKSADAARKASNIAAAGQLAGLEYLQEREALPMQFRDKAMTQLSQLYGLEEGGEEVLAGLQQSPIYSAIMGGLPAAEEAILRQQSATGGLRSGDAQSALAENVQNLQNQALFSSLQGLQGFAGAPSNAGQIAQAMGQIGQTQAAGITGAAQAEQAGMGQLANLGLGIGSLAVFSDIRLKENIKPVGELNGHKWYTWDWNDNANDLGFYGKGEGVMAHEVAQYMPDAIGTAEDYLIVDYSKIGVFH